LAKCGSGARKSSTEGLTLGVKVQVSKPEKKEKKETDRKNEIKGENERDSVLSLMMTVYKSEGMS